MDYYWRMCWQCTKTAARGWIVIDSETPASWIWWIYTGLCKEDAEFKKSVCNCSRRVTEAGDSFLCLENWPTKSTGRGCTVKCKSTTQKFSLWKQIQICTTMQTEMISVFPLNECSQILWFYCTSQQNKTERQSSNFSSLVILHWLFGGGGKGKVLECLHCLMPSCLDILRRGTDAAGFMPLQVPGWPRLALWSHSHQNGAWQVQVSLM